MKPKPSPDKKHKPKISIIIPTHNRRKLLDECLKSVFWQDYKNIEVIVIDDNSDEDIKSHIKNKYPKVNLILNKINKGPSFAKNQGILTSKGDYILFLDSDTELIEKQTLSKMISILKKNKKMGCLGGEIILDKNKRKIKVAGRTFGKEEYIYTNSKNRMKRCGFLNTSNCIVKREIIYKAKGFDPYYFYPMEDADFGLTIRKLGYKNFVAFDVGVLHKYSKDMRLNRIYTLHKAKARFLIKNYGIIKAILSIPNDINKTIIEPINSFLNKKIKQQKTKEEENEILGPVEKSMLRKIYTLTMTPFVLLSAYVWNIFNIKQTLASRNKNFLDPKNMREYEKSLI